MKGERGVVSGELSESGFEPAKASNTARAAKVKEGNVNSLCNQIGTISLTCISIHSLVARAFLCRFPQRVSSTSHGCFNDPPEHPEWAHFPIVLVLALHQDSKRGDHSSC